MGKKKSLKQGFKKSAAKKQKKATPAPLQVTASFPPEKKLNYVWLPRQQG